MILYYDFTTPQDKPIKKRMNGRPGDIALQTKESEPSMTAFVSTDLCVLQGIFTLLYNGIDFCLRYTSPLQPWALGETIKLGKDFQEKGPAIPPIQFSCSVSP